MNQASDVLVKHKLVDENGYCDRIVYRYLGNLVTQTPLMFLNLQVFANNAAALAGGLTAGAVYRTSTGVLMVVF